MTEGQVGTIGVSGEQLGQVNQKDKLVGSLPGTVNSAKLLLLSGVGPAAHLHSLGIQVRLPTRYCS
jgi:choline dehydrogenase-like flavoprotein